MWPAVFAYKATVAFWRAVFLFWLHFVQSVLKTWDVDFGQFQQTINDSAEALETSVIETVLPLVGRVKRAALKITLAGACLAAITAFSALVYAGLYNSMVPLVLQEVPVTFQWFTPSKERGDRAYDAFWEG